MPLNNPSAYGVTQTTGSYVGDGATADKAISHSLGKVPKFIFIQQGDVNKYLFCRAGCIYVSNGNSYIVQTPTSTEFYVGDAVSWAETANANGTTYNYLAIG